jgi:hypothetical protein
MPRKTNRFSVVVARLFLIVCSSSSPLAAKLLWLIYIVARCKSWWTTMLMLMKSPIAETSSA